MKRIIFILLFLFLVLAPVKVFASQASVLGVHILNPSEIGQAKQLLGNEQDDWHYLTVPLSLDDLEKEAEWQAFFKEAKQKKVIPLVRLVTRFENGAWKVPNRHEITSYFEFLNKFEWPTDKRHIIVFNEVNHAAEWGGQINPVSYAQILDFTTDWAHSEGNNYVVLPAAMDLAANTGGSGMSRTNEAFSYLGQIHQYNPDLFSKLDYWNSHSYPNPGFSASPTRSAQNSIRGFVHELAYLKNKTGRDYEVFITETGWVDNASTNRWLTSYYSYSLQHVWSHPQVVAVTPFLLKGDPGPFSGFGFFDRNDQPTAQYHALKEAVEKNRGEG